MFSADDVKRLAALSRIRLSGEETERLTGELSSILHYVDQISSLNITSKDSRAPLTTVMRPDADAYPRGAFAEKLLEEAPEKEGRFFKVKKILTRS